MINLSTPPTSKQQISSPNGITLTIWYLWFTQVYKTIVGLFTSFQVLSSISNTLTFNLDNSASTYVFSGTTTTWTLPDVVKYEDFIFFIKNRGSGNITLQRSGTDKIYTTAAVNSVTIAPGGYYKVQSDGIFWLAMV